MLCNIETYFALHIIKTKYKNEAYPLTTRHSRFLNSEHILTEGSQVIPKIIAIDLTSHNVSHVHSILGTYILVLFKNVILLYIQ